MRPMSAVTIDPKPERVDGRSARALRTRAAIVEGTLVLLEQGKLQPTAQLVAAQARVSVRAVFHHFGDMDGLLQAAVNLQLARHPFDAVVPPLVAAGALEERVVAFARRRAAAYERILPVHRSVLLREAVDGTWAKSLSKGRAGIKAEVRTAFAPEIAAANSGPLVEALDAAAGWPTWESLRVRAGLPFPRALAVLEYTLRSLLGAPR